MSFGEKIAGLMARPNQQQGPAEDQPWYLKYGVRLLGITGGFFFILFGFLNALGIILFKVGCLIAGITQVLVGFVVMALEAPCCFFCLDYVSQLADMADARPMWNRAALYIVFAVVPLFLCFGISDLFASALLFATGVAYGMMGLGKKASREEMAAAATSPTQMQADGAGEMQMGTDQHITLMEDPDVWRPT